ncbi:MAG: hypothetical protein QXF01_01705 [Candidatus Micrarchaeaceae archaeon]
MLFSAVPLRAQSTGQQCMLDINFTGNGTVEVYNLTYSDYISSNSSFNFTCGTSVYIYAQTPNFVRWQGIGPGSYSGTNPIWPITLNGNIQESALFVGNETTTTSTILQVNNTISGECSITGLVNNYGEISIYNATSPANYTYANMTLYYPCGDNVFISAISSYFKNWTCEGRGCYRGPKRLTNFTLNYNVTEIANYEYSSYTTSVPGINESGNLSSNSSGIPTTTANFSSGIPTTVKVQGSSSGPQTNERQKTLPLTYTVILIIGVAILAIAAAYILARVIRSRQEMGSLPPGENV